MPYTSKYILAILVTIVLAGLAVVQGSSALGLTPQQQAIVGVVTAMLGALNGFLPRVTANPTPERKGVD